RVEKSVDPAVLVDVLFRSRPRPEFFTVIAEGDDRIGVTVGDLAKIVDGFLRIGKRNRVPQLLAPRKDLEEPAFVFRKVVAVQLVFAKPPRSEMKVVENRVFDAGLGNVAC